LISESGRYIVFCGPKLVCQSERGWRPLSGAEVLAHHWRIEQVVPLAPMETSLQVVMVADEPSIELKLGLRELLPYLTEREFRLLGTAAQVLEWARNHRFCGRCGARTQPMLGERAMQCPQCGLTQYPRLSPCIIALVTRGRHILLARSNRHRLPIYACLAGFIEAGESAEAAVEREIMEEVGIRVGRLRYRGSQSWPFPHQLMLGYHVDYLSGEIRIDPTELLDARWFPINALPQIPPSQTIAGQLIRSYVQECSSAL